MASGGFVSFVLAFMIGREWPVSGTWAIGVLRGVHLIYGGWSMIALGGIGEAVSDSVDASAAA